MRGRRTGRGGSRRAGAVAGLTALAVVAVLVAVGTRSSGPVERLQTGTQPAAEPAGVDRPTRRFASAMAAHGLSAAALVGSTGGYREVHVTIRRRDGAGGLSRVAARAQELAVDVTLRRSGRGALAAQRSFDAAPGDILVVAADREGRARWAATRPDPRLVRAEQPDAGGRLSGEVVERPSAELVLQVPDSPELTEVRLYLPGPPLSLIGTVPVA